ncbi:aspartyl-phosphate phosphatase Spo0E family protein [Neobacillus cucumis]|uniref:aspartyl-phosphate phosphatase Spo0E family protein n=1 Tax=Neobacillus cucumis TaxID=1740721 RepID=UPI00399CA605
MNVDKPEFLILKCIDRMKRKMIESANYTGLQSEETIKCSQNLDILINKYMKYSINKDINLLINVS